MPARGLTLAPLAALLFPHGQDRVQGGAESGIGGWTAVGSECREAEGGRYAVAVVVLVMEVLVETAAWD